MQIILSWDIQDATVNFKLAPNFYLGTNSTKLHVRIAICVIHDSLISSNVK